MLACRANRSNASAHIADIGKSHTLSRLWPNTLHGWKRSKQKLLRLNGFLTLDMTFGT